MPFGSGLVATFRTERPGPDTVSLVITTVPKRQGGLGLWGGLTAGLCLTFGFGSQNDDIREFAPRMLMIVIGGAALVGIGYKVFVAWAARKASGTVSFFSPTRMLLQQGLEALFPWTERELPRDAVVVLDAVSVRPLAVPSGTTARQPTKYLRLWSMDPDGKSPDQTVALGDAQRATLFLHTFRSPDAAPMPPGAVLLGTAMENPIFRRLAEMLVEDCGCSAYDATRPQAVRLGTKSSPRTMEIAAHVRHAIPMLSLSIRVFLTVVAVGFAGFVALFAQNPYVFVYSVALAVMLVSTRQVLVCDAAGLHLHYSYFMGLWRRGHHHRRWDEITTIQFDSAPSGALVLAIRSADGGDWQIMIPTKAVRRRLEEQFRGFMG